MILISPILRIVGLVISIIIYALTIFSAYGGHFNTEIFTIPGMLTLALPYLAIATTAIAVIWFCFGRWFAGGLGLLALFCAWGPVTTAVPLHASKSATPGAQTFTVLTWNMIHGRDQENPEAAQGNRAIEYIINSGADIVCLQELHTIASPEIPNFTAELEDSLRKAYPYQEGSHRLDTKVLSKYPIKYKPAADYIEGDYDPMRYTFYEVNINGHRLTLVNMHLMSFRLNEEQRNVLTEMKSVQGVRESVSEIKGSIREQMHSAFRKRKEDVRILRKAIEKISGPLVICGDFNDVPESYAYRMLRGEDLHDAYVETGFGPLVTYNQHMFWFHLDQVFYRGALRALSVKKGTLKASDHYPLTAEFEFVADGLVNE